MTKRIWHPIAILMVLIPTFGCSDDTPSPTKEVMRDMAAGDDASMTGRDMAGTRVEMGMAQQDMTPPKADMGQRMDMTEVGADMMDAGGDLGADMRDAGAADMGDAGGDMSDADGGMADAGRDMADAGGDLGADMFDAGADMMDAGGDLGADMLDAGAADMADGGGDMSPATLPDRYAGTKVKACSDAAVMACSANADCLADERCEDISDDAALEVACCVKGQRGPIPTGSVCQGIAAKIECEETLCIAKNNGPHYCTKRCTMNAECPAPISTCNAFLGACVTTN